MKVNVWNAVLSNEVSESSYGKPVGYVRGQVFGPLDIVELSAAERWIDGRKAVTGVEYVFAGLCRCSVLKREEFDFVCAWAGQAPGMRDVFADRRLFFVGQEALAELRERCRRARRKDPAQRTAEIIKREFAYMAKKLRRLGYVVDESAGSEHEIVRALFDVKDAQR